MFLEKLWPHLPTPWVNLLVLVEAALVFVYSTDNVILSLTFIVALTVSFIMGSVKISQPFHIERVAVMLTLAFINVSFLAQHSAELNDALHLHTSSSIMASRLIYALVWLVLLVIAIVGYFRNVGQPVSRAWPLIAILTLLATLIPLEPDSFVMNQPVWLWIIRVLLALILFTLVTVGDTAALTLGLYYQRATVRRRKGERILDAPNAAEAELPFARTIIWLPITLWVMFVPSALVIAAVVLVVFIARSVVDRWQRANAAHGEFVVGQNLLYQAAHYVGLDRLTSVIEDIEQQALDMVREHIQKDKQKRDARNKHKRKKDDDTETSDNSNEDHLVIEVSRLASDMAQSTNNGNRQLKSRRAGQKTDVVKDW